MSGEPERTGSRLLDACLAVLFGAMALYGAVSILKAVWVYLCVLFAIIGIIAVVGWVITAHIRRW